LCAPTEHLGDVGQMEAHFGPFGDTVNLDARYVLGLRQAYHRIRNHFRRTRLYSYVMWVKWKLVLVPLEIVLISRLDRCMVCTKHPIAQKLFWAHPMELLGDKGQLEACFGLFEDSVNLSAR
jgi:hypothetical protein